MASIPSSQPFSNPQMQHFEYQGVDGATSNPLELDSIATLLIRHLPEAIPHETLLRLFSHYGASSVRPCSTGKLRNCAFVDFKNEALAYQAHRQLNGLRFLGKVLSVERASKPSEDNKPQKTGVQLAKDFPQSASLVKDANLTQDLTQGSRSGSIPASEPIALRLGVDYPFPPHLEYAYPPPDGNILTNIVNALIAVPRFYTQVLHLMNKMNIPAPFRMALPTPPLPPPIPAPQAPPPPPPPSSTPAKAHFADASSSESEMESSDEELNDKDVPKSARKRARREVIVGPAIDKSVAHEAVGVKPATLIPKEIPLIKKKNPVLQIKIAPKHIPNEQKDDDDDDEATNGFQEPNEEDSDAKRFATADELEKGKLPPEEILSLPMFKNYTAGNPASVLYIKNLAKDVVPEDFYFIFGSLFGSIGAAKSGLNVKLMQEGRMRGQAFVTFPSVELAHRALSLVNGYVFKGKPIIIQFGRNPSAAKTN
ncbi:LOW QUALITY PROTEIN: U11/U12 small nuclear ribonucleoprotein 65 kDa protein-like [Durio zibethinus]|uniref:LOW QUALITY PROTEIN: U11/U12 small nuclear ribonucleoprotein 65 kDa protein-like n=1 Tax=Durio zibethinus TaxID=66656 RepID=A0A6P5WT25_DURZI|nr:LOW QUALITY PROTEIN: U11/U12 small nuclear ribonucleoprotein 65 kDa protein-like [Durio zibethinus]